MAQTSATYVFTGVSARVISIRSSRSAFSIRRLVILTCSSGVGGGCSMAGTYKWPLRPLREGGADDALRSPNVFTRGLMTAVRGMVGKRKRVGNGADERK